MEVGTGLYNLAKQNTSDSRGIVDVIIGKNGLALNRDGYAILEYKIAGGEE